MNLMSKKRTKHRNRASPWKIFGILVILGALGWGIVSLVRSMRPEITTTTAAPTTTTTTTTDIQAEILMGTIERITRANVRILVGNTLGSGTVIGEDDTYYYAITNQHVIAGEELTLSLKTWEGADGPFEILATDVDLDLALIRFAKAGRAMIIPLDFNQDPDSHDPVVSIGFPYGELTITFGIFEGFGTYLFEGVVHDIILHSAAIGAGSSGGALVDLHGNLLGINTWKLGEDMYAIPASVVKGFIDSNHT